MADPVKLHRNYPPVDFRVGCSCPACELATLLWYTEDEHPAREAWHLYWDKLTEHDVEQPFGEWRDAKRPCLWQWRQHNAVNATAAYKIC